jgi:NADPH-dependent glutamate synthase beta subunit-like oxidoreductase/ferredoxin
VNPTDTSNPDYFHKVVDCQWACPAHTDVPEYIRLIAQGRYADAYMVNRESNVFPGILGRVCDRPCEPACRRGRVDEKPVAICRLKRVAADLRGEISQRLPTIPKEKNGKRVALIGAGSASLTVANDLLPLGYEIVMFEKLQETGGLMRSNIPAFRLPPRALDEEINIILDMGVDLRLGAPVTSLRALLAEGYDAVFVGTGAPLGRNLEIPGRYDTDQIFVGIQWLESVAFGHTNSIGERVVVIGGGNTAMDCCRTSLRLGGKDVKVIARKPMDMLKASDWELEGAIEENVEMVTNHAPEEFIVENGKLTGVKFSEVEWYEDEDGRLRSKKLKDVIVPCDSVILAIGQENAFSFIERDIGLEFDNWDMPIVDKVTMQSTRERVFFGGDAAFGPLNIIWAVEHGHQAAISIHNCCQGIPVSERPSYGMNLASTKMGIHEWSYSNDFDAITRRLVPHVSLNERFQNLDIEVELGFKAEQTVKEVERCLNCDMQTVFKANICIECDACVDVCPVSCLIIAKNGSEDELRLRLKTPALNKDQDIFVSETLPQTGKVMVKDENVCIHCGLCAERCPTGAWDMQKFTLNIPYATHSPCTKRKKIA